MFFMVLGMMGGGGGGGEAKLTRCMSLLLLVGEELDFSPLGGPTEGKLPAESRQKDVSQDSIKPQYLVI